MRTNGNYEKSLALRNTVETLTFSFKTANQKKYVFGALPIADAFITWAEAGVASKDSNFCFYKFHLLSLLVFVVILSVFIFLWRRLLFSKRTI
jgi:hypothetical protein